MDNKINIREVDVLDTGLTNERKLCSMNYERNYGNVTMTRRNDFEMDHKMIIKEEADILDIVLPNERECFSIDFGNIFKNDAVTRSSDFESKEWAFISDSGFQKEKVFSSDLVKKIKKEFIVYNENGEVSVQKMSTETEHQSETSDSDVLLESEKKDWMGESFPSTESRLDSGVAPRDNSALFSDEDSGKDLSFNTRSACGTVRKYKSKEISSLQKSVHAKQHYRGETNSKSSSLKQNSSQEHDNCKKRLIHESKGSHKCNTCGKCFTQLSSLKRHKLIHEGQKPHKCDTCGNYFTQLSSLNRHKLIHEDQKPHKCDICVKCFTHLSALKSNKLIHEGHKPYKCDACGSVLLNCQI